MPLFVGAILSVFVRLVRQFPISPLKLGESLRLPNWRVNLGSPGGALNGVAALASREEPFWGVPGDSWRGQSFPRKTNTQSPINQVEGFKGKCEQLHLAV